MSPAARPRISLVVAMARNRVIGRDKGLPWHLPADLRHFKALTMGKPIVMGRRTWESLPGLLPGRRHIVVTRNPGYRAEGAEVVHSLDEAVTAAGPVNEIMVVGGANLYAQALPLADRIYLTLIEAEIDGDTFFPSWDSDEWVEVASDHHPADDRNVFACRFIILERKPPVQGR